MYKQALHLVTQSLGSDTTSGAQLDRYGRQMFGKKWHGVFAADEIKADHEGFYIANLDKANQRGSHWVALAVKGPCTYFFDSFGRGNQRTLKLEDPNHYIISEQNPTILQGKHENSCGQRCLAWLLLFDRDPSAALDI